VSIIRVYNILQFGTKVGFADILPIYEI